MESGANEANLREQLSQQLAQHKDAWPEYAPGLLRQRFPDSELHEILATKVEQWSAGGARHPLISESRWQIIHDSQPDELRTAITRFRQLEELPGKPESLAKLFFQRVTEHWIAHIRDKAQKASEEGYALDPGTYCPIDGRLYVPALSLKGYRGAVVGRWDEGVPIWGICGDTTVDLLDYDYHGLDDNLIYGRHRELLKWLTEVPEAHRKAFRESPYGHHWQELRTRARAIRTEWPTQNFVPVVSNRQTA